MSKQPKKLLCLLLTICLLLNFWTPTNGIEASAGSNTDKPQITIGEWYAVGPFSQDFDKSFPPEEKFDPSRTYEGKNGVVVAWEKLEGWEDPKAMHDLHAFYAAKYSSDNEMVNDVAAYMHTTLTVSLNGEFDLFLGSDDWIKVWIDGTLVHSNHVWRGAEYGQDYVLSLPLSQGTHDVLIAVGQGGGGWGFFFDVRPAGPRSLPLNDWYLSGPFTLDFAKDFGPEAYYEQNGKVDLTQVYTVKDGSVVGWDRVEGWENSKKYHDIRALFEAKYPDRLEMQENTTVYAYTTLVLEERKVCDIKVGSDDGIKVWLDGKVIISRDVYRGASYGQDSVSVNLPAGQHTILVKITQAGGGWGFYTDVIPSETGLGINITLDPEGTYGLYALDQVLDGKLKVKIEAFAQEVPNQPVSCMLKIVDVRGNTVYETSEALLFDHEGSVKLSIPVVLKHTGYYEIEVTINGLGDPISKLYVFGVVPGPHKGLRPDSFFASNSGTKNVEFDRLIGLKVYRTGVAASGTVGPESAVKPEYWKPELDPKREFSPDMFDFSEIDKNIQKALDNEISILGIIGYANPEWARSEEAQRIGNYGPPRDDDEFINVTVPVVKHLYDKGFLKYIEFWNEPWIYEWTWADTGDRFRNLVKKWWAKASEQCPDLKLVLGESASFLDDHLFIDPEIKEIMYADCNHPYAEVNRPNSRQGRILRSLDYQVLNSEKNGIKAHYVTEDGVVNVGESDKEKVITGSKLIVTHHVLAALSGIYQMNIQKNMGFDTNQLPGAVAYGVMTHFLEDRVPVADIWPENQLIYGAIFANHKYASLNMPRAKEFSARWNVPVPSEYENDKLKVAVLWNVTGKDEDNLTPGTISIPAVKDLKAYDIYGMPVGEVKNDRLVLPFTEEPMYVVSEELGVREMYNLIRVGKIEKVQPVNMYINLITKPLEQHPELTIRIQNQVNILVSGKLEFELPEGWQTLYNNKYFTVMPGKVKEIRVPLAKVQSNPENLYPVKVKIITNKYGTFEYSQTVQVAYAPKKTIKFTGSLSNWEGVTPTTVDSRSLALGIDWTRYVLNPHLPPPGNIPETYISTKTYTAYDEKYFYFAFAVNEPSLKQDSDGNLDGLGKPWWYGDVFDVAFGFGERNKYSLRKAGDPWAWKGAYRDTDYVYILYKDRNGVDHFTRIRKPDSPRTTPFQLELSAKFYPYMGEVEGAKVKITRNEDAKLTLYEVAVPLAEIGKPGGLDENFRFGFVQRNNEGLGALEYSKAAGVFDYWIGGDSFLPTWENMHACTTWLGIEKVEE